MNELKLGSLIDAITEQIARVFPHSFGSNESYEWLFDNFGVTADDDARWQHVIDDESAEALNPHDTDDAATIAFLKDENALIAFLEGLLEKYQSSELVYPGEMEPKGAHIERAPQGDRRGHRSDRRVPPASAQNEPVKVRLLDATALVGGKPVKLGPAQWRAVAALALARTGLDTDALAERVYGERREGANALWVLMSRVRARLGEETIVQRTRSYRFGARVELEHEVLARMISDLKPDCELDVSTRALFEEVAVRTEHGIAPLPDAEWVAGVHVRLHALVCDVVRALVRDANLRGDSTNARRWARRLFDEDRCNEVGVELALRVFDGLAERVRIYREHETALAHEAGATPSAHLLTYLEEKPVAGKILERSRRDRRRTSA